MYSIHIYHKQNVTLPSTTRALQSDCIHSHNRFIIFNQPFFFICVRSLPHSSAAVRNGHSHYVVHSSAWLTHLKYLISRRLFVICMHLWHWRAAIRMWDTAETSWHVCCSLCLSFCNTRFVCCAPQFSVSHAHIYGIYIKVQGQQG